MIHIGIDARLNYYRVGGISTYTSRLISALEELDNQNQYTVFQSRKASQTLTTRFTEARLWTPAHHRLERLALSAELLPYKLDMLHSPDFIPPARGAKRHVITVHDMTFMLYPEHKDAASIRYYSHQIEKAVKQADHILAVSEATKNDIIDMLNVPQEKITVQAHGVDEGYKPLPEETLSAWRTKLNLPENYILHVGTLEPRKNIPALLDAYLTLPPGIRNKHSLLLVGRSGWLFDETMQRIERLQSDGAHILIRSDIDDNALAAVYNLATVLTMPSFYEGFGMPALEAMACGTPTIVSNRSSLPEVVGDVGLQIDPEDPSTLATALEQALTDIQWQQTTSKAGIERSKQFTWENSARVALSVYQSVL